MLSRDQRLSSAQFDRAYANSLSVRHPLVALKAHRRDDDCDDDCDDDSDQVRAAFVVPKKQGKAVQRNRARRRLRECYRLHARRDDLTGCDLIFLSTPATHTATATQLDEAIDDVLRRMKRKLGGSFSATEGTENAQKNSEKREEILALDSESERDRTQSSEFFCAFSVPSVAENASASISVFSAIALSVIRFYQRFISPGLPPSCRFYPSCSRYTYGAIERFGLPRGLWLGCYRVCRCHPWNAGGIDEVPAQFPALQSVKARSIEKTQSILRAAPFRFPTKLTAPQSRSRHLQHG